ncbi:MAG: putative RNA uridine N3 methyltransferase [Promethearchaeota archaeon]
MLRCKELISIAIPDTSLEDCHDLRTKTEKLFYIGRAMAIFKVDNCLIYRTTHMDKNVHKKEVRRMKTILEYLACPQYLRKAIFPLKRDLEYAGILSPLATPSHKPSKAKVRQGEIREGLIFLGSGNIPLAEVGLKHPIKLLKPPKMSITTPIRTYLRMYYQNNRFVGEVVPFEEAKREMYLGFQVKVTDALLSRTLKGKKNDLKIVCSRDGRKYTSKDVEMIQKSQNKVFIFGSPKIGVPGILKSEGSNVSEVSDICLNFIPSTGTRTVRLEEAIMITLARTQS